MKRYVICDAWVVWLIMACLGFFLGALGINLWTKWVHANTIHEGCMSAIRV